MGACRSNLVDSGHLEPRHQRAQRHAKWRDARDSSHWKHERGRKRWRNSRCGAVLMMLIVGALCSRPLLTLTPSPLCEECNEERNAPDYLDKL